MVAEQTNAAELDKPEPVLKNSSLVFSYNEHAMSHH